ncbi:MAG: hypothetical protein M1395_08790 [Bacteroidetes bacterium]|nr:hypothetical protein [Bacteroidota bacterium]
MNSGKIGKIVLSKVLAMPLEKYLAYIDKKIHQHIHHIPAEIQAALRQQGQQYSTLVSNRKVAFAKVWLRDGKPALAVLDPRLKNRIPLEHSMDHDNGIVALKWINTRNELSKHILRSLLDYQRAFWRSGKEVDLKPLTLKQFLSLYPCNYLDQSRLSRLVSNLLVEAPHGEIVRLRHLFLSGKRHCAYHIKEIINVTDESLTDNEIQYLLRERNIHLSLRVICNCRKLLGIPNYRERASHYYGKNIRFSDYIRLLDKRFNCIPSEPGVYELSLSYKVRYLKHRCDVLYIGSSTNVRKRVSSYSGRSIRNTRLRPYIQCSDVRVRYFTTESYSEMEKELLKHFKKTYGELPKGNSIGG